MTLRVGLAADFHLGKRLGARTDAAGVNLRSRDLEAAVSRVVDGMVAAKVDVAVVAGDLFDAASPPEHARQFLVREVARLRAGLGPDARVLLLRGNHEHPSSLLAGTAVGTAALALPGVTVVDGYAVETVLLPGLALTLVPWQQDDEAFLRAIEAVRPVEGAHNLLVLHCGLADLPEYAELRPGSQTLTRGLVPPGFDWIYSGHFHGHRELPDLRWTFIGSPERLSVSEVGTPKGWVLHEAPTGRRAFHPVATRAWYDVEPLDAAGMDGDRIVAAVRAIRDALPDWPEAIVRLRVANVAPDVYAALDMAALRRTCAEAFHADLAVRPADLAFAAAAGAEEAEGRPLLDDLGSEWSRFAATLIGRDPDEVAAVARLGAAALKGGDLDAAIAAPARPEAAAA